MDTTFYSNGKLLLTGEYLVLDGAKALALPTKYGQNLIVKEGKTSEIEWKSFDSDSSCWFSTSFSFETIISGKILDNTEDIKNTLIKILHQAYLLNPGFLITKKGYCIETHLSFPRLWGLGTSSTLINNIAQWTGVNAFTLLNNSFGGSGYDIACAQNNTAVIYQLINGNPFTKLIFFNPAFYSKIYFVYLNQKQNSKTAIAAYYKNRKAISSAKNSIDIITQKIATTNNIVLFSSLLEEHETIMSSVLETKTVKESLFSDFKGSIKSLGAWGGDFIMVVSKENPEAYFNQKGYSTILSYKDMIL